MAHRSSRLQVKRYRPGRDIENMKLRPDDAWPGTERFAFGDGSRQAGRTVAGLNPAFQV
jgi:hypothetical protein